MANIDKPAGFRVAQMPGSFPVYTGKTTNNLSLTPGDAIVRLPTGSITIASAISTAILGVCQSKITGIPNTQQDVLYVPALPTILFSGQCSGTPVEATIGKKCDIEGTSGIMELNEDLASTKVAQIVGFEGGVKNTMGAHARVLFVWASSRWTGQA